MKLNKPHQSLCRRIFECVINDKMICESLDIVYGKRILCYNKLCLEYDVALCYSSELEGGIHVDRYYRCELFIRNALGCKTNAYNGLVSTDNIMAGELHRIKPLIAMAMYAQLQNINQESAERAENLLYELLQSDDRDRIINLVEEFNEEINGH